MQLYYFVCRTQHVGEVNHTPWIVLQSGNTLQSDRHLSTSSGGGIQQIMQGTVQQLQPILAFETGGVTTSQNLDGSLLVVHCIICPNLGCLWVLQARTGKVVWPSRVPNKVKESEINCGSNQRHLPLTCQIWWGSKTTGGVGAFSPLQCPSISKKHKTLVDLILRLGSLLVLCYDDLI